MRKPRKVDRLKDDWPPAKVRSLPRVPLFLLKGVLGDRYAESVKFDYFYVFGGSLGRIGDCW